MACTVFHDANRLFLRRAGLVLTSYFLEPTDRLACSQGTVLLAEVVAHSEHAPLYASWGYDNRNAAVRLINTSEQATRIEHRVSGADANPYLAIATLLAGAHFGIANQIEPGNQMLDDDDEEFERLSCNWDDGIEQFADSEFIAQYLGTDYQKLYAACKSQELSEFRLRVTDVEYDAYLRNV